MTPTRCAILAAALLGTAGATPDAAPAAQPPTRVVEVRAERFQFWPSQITLQQGEQVEIRVSSDDTAHGFRIVGTGTNLTIPKRGKGQAVATFRATQPGRYSFECSRMCGAGHNFMRGVLIVRAAEGGSAQP